MTRSANKRKAAKLPASRWMMMNGTALIAQNPVLVGGATAFLLTVFFVSANALWYQPHGHPAALFPTRALLFQAPDEKSALPPAISEELETTIRIEREDVAPEPGDPVVEKVQSVLSDLDLYTGSVDGIAGPQTREAIRNYRRIMGLEQTDTIDEDLLDQLGTKPDEQTVAATPVPVARPGADAEQPVAAGRSERGAIVVRIQAGLRAFGHDQIEIDGITGPQTREAILEFQRLFGLEPNGAADATVLTKMRELGLAN